MRTSRSRRAVSTLSVAAVLISQIFSSLALGGMLFVPRAFAALPLAPLFWAEEDTTQVKVDWEAASGADSYVLYHSTDNVTFSDVFSGALLTFTHTVPDGSDNWYRVTAVNSDGEFDTAAPAKYAGARTVVIDDAAMAADFNASGTAVPSAGWSTYDINTSGAESILSFATGGDNHSVPGAFGSQTFDWTTTPVLGGTYEVFVNYICDSSRGTADYNVYSGVTQLNGSPIAVNQALKSSDGSPCGSQSDPVSQPFWKSIGTFAFSGTGRVQLVSATGNNIVADAVAFRQLSCQNQEDHPVFPVSHSCSGPGQLCDTPFAIDNTEAFDAAYYFNFDVADGHCSEIRLHVYVEGVLHHTTPFFGMNGASPQTSGPTFIGNFPGGTNVDVDLVAEGQVGGCNTGTLSSWGGTAVLDAVEICTNACIETSDIAAYWKVDEGTSTTADDSTPYNNVGTLQNSASWTASPAPVSFPNPNALSLDGSDDYILVSDTTGIPSGGSARTLALWMNADVINPQGTLLSIGNGGTLDQKFIFQVGTSGLNTYVFTDGINGSNNITITGGEIPPTGGWHHVAFTLDGSNNWEYFLDGSLTKSGTFPTAINTVVNAVEIGSRHDVTAGFFDGSLDDIRIYDRKLTSGEIASLAAGVCSVQPQAQCGDGSIDQGEQCDDTNTTNDDGCSSTCQIESGWTCANEPSQCSPICGDGQIDGTEQCDDGNTVQNDGCTNACTLPVCGDSIIQAGEQCDDGNTNSGDGCSSTCQAEVSNACNGLAPTVYVQNGVIVGGPDNGQLYMGTLRGGPGDDVIVGTDGPDNLYGFDGDDTICGMGGPNRIFGGPGNDWLMGGTSVDRIEGGSGNDTLIGDLEADSLYGQDGDDLLCGGLGGDRLAGGGGNDQLDGGVGFDYLTGQTGTDACHRGESSPGLCETNSPAALPACTALGQ